MSICAVQESLAAFIILSVLAAKKSPPEDKIVRHVELVSPENFFVFQTDSGFFAEPRWRDCNINVISH